MTHQENSHQSSCNRRPSARVLLILPSAGKRDWSFPPLMVPRKKGSCWGGLTLFQELWGEVETDPFLSSSAASLRVLEYLQHKCIRTWGKWRLSGPKVISLRNHPSRRLNLACSLFPRYTIKRTVPSREQNPHNVFFH